MERIVVGVVRGWSLADPRRKQNPAGAQGSQVPRGDGRRRQVDESRRRRENRPETQAEVAHRGGGGGEAAAAARVCVSSDVPTDLSAFAAHARASARSNHATRPRARARVSTTGGGSPVAHGGGGGGDGDGGGVSRARFAAARVAGWRSRGCVRRARRRLVARRRRRVVTFPAATTRVWSDSREIDVKRVAAAVLPARAAPRRRRWRR